jgi:ribose transport system substrate-binding protein
VTRRRSATFAGSILAAALIATTALAAPGAAPKRKISDLSIAWFLAGTNNTYVQTNARAAFATAKKLGAKIHLFDGNWDATNQVNQMQHALADKQYNAWLVEAVDPVQECDTVKQAMAKKIPVFVTNQGLCGNDTFTPGTIGFVGGQTRSVYTRWFNWIFSHNKSGAKVAILTGPDLNYNTNNLEYALKKVLPKYPNVKVVADVRTDYTTNTAFQKAQDILQAHPDVNVFLANYSEPTKGIVTAVQAAGKTGQVKVYDMGGNKWAIDAVKKGEVAMSLPFLPYEEVKVSVQFLANSWTGKPIPFTTGRFYDLTKELKFPGAPFVTKANASKFKPEY